MAVRKIIRMGHPTLRQTARKLRPDELGTEDIRRLVTDMTDTLKDYGGVGLAAPQVGESIRLAIIELNGGPSRYGQLPVIPLTVFVNPEIEVLTEDTAGHWEGCLSVPGLRGFVERPQHIKVHALNLKGEPFVIEFQNFGATVIQHELDHLDGKLFVDRIRDSTQLVFEAEFNRYITPEG